MTERRRYAAGISRERERERERYVYEKENERERDSEVEGERERDRSETARLRKMDNLDVAGLEVKETTYQFFRLFTQFVYYSHDDDGDSNGTAVARDRYLSCVS